MGSLCKGTLIWTREEVKNPHSFSLSKKCNSAPARLTICKEKALGLFNRQHSVRLAMLLQTEILIY
jgi:hypothetical protein